MKSFNKVMLIGNLTADPESRITQTGVSVAYFTLAVNRKKRAGQDEVADFHRVVAWGTFADLVTRLLKKGMSIFMVGNLQSHSFEGKNGKQYVTEIVLQDLNILTWKGKESRIQEPEVEEVDLSGEEISATMAA